MRTTYLVALRRDMLIPCLIFGKKVAEFRIYCLLFRLFIVPTIWCAEKLYGFKNKETREYFEANCKEQDIEYKADAHFSEEVFNETERKNIELIRQMEWLQSPTDLRCQL